MLVLLVPRGARRLAAALSQVPPPSGPASARSQRGAIFIEQIVAMSVLAVVVIGVLSLLSVGYLSAISARNLDEATNLAQRKLEQVRSAGCDAAVPLSRQPVDAPAFRGYEWEVEVIEHAPGLKEVKATVYWQVRGRQRNVSLVTLVRAAR